MNTLLYQEKIKGDKPKFIDKLLEVSERLDFNPNWLMAVFNKESGVNPQARNTAYPVGGKPATGLIQWVEPTAQGLYGFGVDEIYEMDGVEQLELVYKYFEKVAYKITKYSDVYRHIFFPVSLGKGDDYIFKTSSLAASTVAKQNPVIDLDKDSKITNREFDEYSLKGIPEPWKTQFRENTRDSTPKFVKRNWIEITSGIVMIIVGFYLMYKFYIAKK